MEMQSVVLQTREGGKSRNKYKTLWATIWQENHISECEEVQEDSRLSRVCRRPLVPPMQLTERVYGAVWRGTRLQRWTRLRWWKDVNYRQTIWDLVDRTEKGCLFNGPFKAFLKASWSCGEFEWERLQSEETD